MSKRIDRIVHQILAAPKPKHPCTGCEWARREPDGVHPCLMPGCPKKDWKQA